MNKVHEIRKAVVAFVGALGTWGATAAADGTYDQVELWGLCAVVVTGLTAWGVPNVAAIRSTKKNPWEGPLTGPKDV